MTPWLIVAAGLLPSAAPPPKAVDYYAQVEIFGPLASYNDRVWEPWFISIRRGAKPSQFFLDITKVRKQWSDNKWSKMTGRDVLVKGSLEEREVQVRPGVKEYHLVVIVTSLKYADTELPEPEDR